MPTTIADSGGSGGSGKPRSASQPDIVIGRILDPDSAHLLAFESLAEEPHSLIARAGHPLSRRRRLGVEDLVDFTWVLPPHDSMLRERLNAMFLQHGLPLPARVVETSSVPMITNLLGRSDMPVALPVDVVRPYCDAGMLRVLPIAWLCVQFQICQDVQIEATLRLHIDGIMEMPDAKEIPRHLPARRTKPKAAPSVKAGSIKGQGHKVLGVLDGFTTRKSSPSHQQGHVHYVRSKGIDDFVTKVHAAEPIRLIETERMGVAGVFVKDLSKRMEIPAQRMFVILGVPKATAEKKVASGELLTGNGGRAALGMARLLGIAQEIVENSTAPQAKDFDSAKWLGQWLEKPQPALGGRKPAELIDTPTGVEVVAKLLAAIESGAYQ